MNIQAETLSLGPKRLLLVLSCYSCRTTTFFAKLLVVPSLQSFLENSHPAIQSLESLQTRAIEEFSKVASFFGEDGQISRPEAFFGIFAEFISKFEVSQPTAKSGWQIV